MSTKIALCPWCGHPVHRLSCQLPVPQTVAPCRCDFHLIDAEVGAA
jgi:hypothetical protein